MTTTACPVLLVEDDDDLREVMADVLVELGYQVVQATNGEEALHQLRTGDCLPCLILLDLRMPVMDGWQFREEQQKDPALANIPVVALSGHAELRAFDAVAHLIKPVQFNPLASAVERFCARPP